MDEIAGPDFHRAQQPVEPKRRPDDERAVPPRAPEAWPGSLGQERFDGPDPTVLRHVPGFEAEQPVASCDGGAGGPCARPRADPDMSGADLVRHRRDRGIVSEQQHCGVHHEPRGGAGHERRERHTQRLELPVGQDESRDHAALVARPAAARLPNFSYWT